MLDDTIAAIATALGESGIGVIRVSGPSSLSIVDKVFVSSKYDSVEDIPNFHAAYGKIINYDNDSIIDEALVLVMRAPRSYTRENVVEIHCHG